MRELLRGHDSLNHPFAITLFENNIYWTDWRSNSIIRVNKWNSTDLSVIQRTLTQLFDIKILHPSRQPRSKENQAIVLEISDIEAPKLIFAVSICLDNYNPCEVNNGNCSHLCLLSTNQTYKCACPHIMILMSDNRTCEGI